jgi:hypothetical protein
MATFQSMENYFGQHPYVGAFITGAHLLLGATLGNASEPEIPKIVMQSAQLGAWIVAMLAGCITIYGVFKTHHGKKSKK